MGTVERLQERTDKIGDRWDPEQRIHEHDKILWDNRDIQQRGHMGEVFYHCGE